MDARAQQAREHHEAAARTSHEADIHRQQRDQLVRALRAEDPEQWSYGRLAKAVGCSKELIRLILKENRVKIFEEDLKFKYFYARGQTVNEGPRGVAVTHLPTEKEFVATDGRSQLENKAVALEALKEWLASKI